MVESLTERERQVLRLIANGKSTKLLAAELGITFKTAACHRYRLLAKTGASNTAELVSLAMRTGLLELSGKGTLAKPDGNARAAQVCQEIRRDRALLSEAIQRSALLQAECRKARQEFSAERQRMVKVCQALLDAARIVAAPAEGTAKTAFSGPATSADTPPRRFPPSTPRGGERPPER